MQFEEQTYEKIGKRNKMQEREFEVKLQPPGGKLWAEFTEEFGEED